MKEITPAMSKIKPTEEMFIPVNHEEYLKNDKYHSSDKGCDCEIIEEKGKIYSKTRNENNNIAVLKYCKTHNVLCSKTGWELGYFHNSNSKKEFQMGDYNYCRKCGIGIKKRFKLCPECSKEKRKNLNKIYRLKHKKPPKEKKEPKIKSTRLDRLLGFINEYQKADYEDRIYCKDYHDLVNKADYLLRKYKK